MCEMATVSRASFYRSWENKAPTEAEMALRDAIQRMAVTHRFYGYRRIAVLVQREGYEVGAKKVRRLMKKDNLLAVRRRKFVATTDSDHDFVVYPNLAEHVIVRDVNQLWVADITYIRLRAEFVYLAVVLDAFSRRIVGWAMANHLRTELVLDALNMALGQRRPQDVIHHSDQGCQYTSIAFGARCRQAGVRPSMGSVGDCYDNAMCESFFATLECELLERRRFTNQVEARMAVFEFIEGWYNSHRRHSSLHYLSPMEFERRWVAPTPATEAVHATA